MVMSKKLSKEEMRLYQKSRRGKCKALVKPVDKIVKPPCKAPVLDVKPLKSVKPDVKPCKACLEKNVTISELRQKILLFESIEKNESLVEQHKGWTPSGLITEKYKLRPIG